MSSLFWWLYWIFAYTVGITGLVIEIYRTVKHQLIKESLIFTISFLLLIVVSTMSEYQYYADVYVNGNHNPDEMTHLWHHIMMFSVILLSYTFPAWVHSIKKYPYAALVNRSLGVTAVLYAIGYGISIPIGFTPHITILILITLVATSGYGLVLLYRRPSQAAVASKVNFDRLLVIICVVCLPFVVLFDMFYHELAWLQRLSPHRLHFLPLFYTLFCLVRIADGVAHLSTEPTSASTTAGMPQLNWDAICSRFRFTDREKEVIELLLEGKSYAQIGTHLFVSTATVKSHIQNVYRKAGSSNKIELIRTLYAHPPSSL